MKHMTYDTCDTYGHVHTHMHTHTHTEGALTWLRLFSGAFPASAAEEVAPCTHMIFRAWGYGHVHTHTHTHTHSYTQMHTHTHTEGALTWLTHSYTHTHTCIHIHTQRVH
jgi:hypothetical protein